MGELMRGIPFKDIMKWSHNECMNNGSIYGLRQEKFYKNNSGTSIEIFGNKISSPVGPAAGPNAQLAQNILVSYLSGSRFIELKTVQIIDGEDLRKAVPRPCINAEDEAYNVEWSTEFTVEEARDEYIKAWFACHVVAKELEISDKRDFVFNMSVGYDLKGIKSKKVDGFISDLYDASNTDMWKECYNYLEENIDGFRYFTMDDLKAISPAVAPSITLSTLHGCPPEEIEAIVMHLINEKNIHTYIKCNPTLLGYDFVRKTLDGMGYDYLSFTDHHFKNDLQIKDAVPMIKKLRAAAKAKNLDFGVKITNTFPVKIEQNELPGEEMYMSGRALFPLSINVANILSKEFNGELPISYSGGADHFNIEKLIKAGIQPITVATTILKPGGYGRITQLAKDVEPFLNGSFKGIDLEKMEELTKYSVSAPRHQKSARKSKGIETDSTLGLFDCFKAPCKDGGCPINQQIPEYINLVDQGKYDEAFKIIAIDNALPAVTGTICDHNCQRKCTRNDYDDAVAIRDSKLKASVNAQDNYIKNMKVTSIKTDKKAVVIGAGPAGIAVSFFLRRNGMDVTVLEKRDKPYGIVEYVIPEFRVSSDILRKDYEMAVKSGANFKYGVNPNYNISDLKKDYDYVIIATGAWKEGRSPVSKGQEKVIDALKFLEQSKANNLKVDLGERVAIIGAGDVAMDCARAAVRAPGVKESVIVYRRTKEFMPALTEEIEEAELDGVKFMELLSPVSYDGKTLTVEVQELTDKRDSSGRKIMQGTGKIESIAFDTVIGAVGARVDSTLFKENGLNLNKWDSPIVTARNETNIKDVYVAGDCKEGAATIVKAIADGKAIAKDILAKAFLSHDFVKVEILQPEAEIYSRKGVLKSLEEKDRCLTCDQICELCCDVCPNRANMSIVVNSTEFKLDHQILHIDGMCNECGNCGTFCPHTGNPYQDKFTLFWTAEDFKDSTNKGFLQVSEDEFKVRLENMEIVDYKIGVSGVIPKEMEYTINTVVTDYSYILVPIQI